MPKGPTLDDLNDGRFEKEPMKNKRMENPQFDSSKKSTKDNPKFKMVPTIDWTLNARYLLCHLFYNVLGETRGRGPKDKLPSIDEAAINKFKSAEALDIGLSLVQFRRDSKTLASLKNAMSHVRDDTYFMGAPSPTGKKAIVTFQPMGYDCIERIFTRKGESIPLNTDKRARKAFITPESTIPVNMVADENLQYIPRGELDEG